MKPALPPAETEVIRGQLERITYVNEENGYSVYRIRVQGEDDPVVAVGISAPHAPGEDLELTGCWADHPRFGIQFQFSDCRQFLPSTAEGIKKYLCSGLVKGIGPAMALRIVEEFGESSLDVLDKDPEALLKVRGIGRRVLDTIKRSWELQRGVSSVMRSLQDLGISAGFAAKIYRVFGDDSAKIVRDNPYRLAEEIFGIGFITADNIARGMGVPHDSEMRLDAGVRHVMGELTGEGHVYAPKDMLAEKSGQLLGVSTDDAGLAVDRALSLRALRSEIVEAPDGLGESVIAVYLPAYYVFEAKCAEMLAQLMKPRPEEEVLSGFDGIDPDEAVAWAQRVRNISLSEKQADALRMALKSKVLVITGGPGTGKTTLISAIIGVLGERGVRINLAAPTGRAAKRMAEATGQEALTLHRLLESDGRNFGRDEDAPLDCDLLIVDETSMVDIHLMYRLLCAMPRDSHLILVGDIHQLPSVGPGNVLNDLISSGVIPVAELNVIFRQARDSGIIVNAHRVNAGIVPVEEASASGLKDFYFIEQDDPAKCVDIILSLVSDRIPKRFGLDPVEDVQVLTPMHKGLLGASNLNAVLRGELNPGGGNSISVGNRTFKSGDKVMQIRNDYEKEVYNGDIGIITTVDPNARLVIVEFDGGSVGYEAEGLDKLVHAYAVSIHKSQGSEYPAVVIPIHTQHYILLQRNLLYTGITRAKELVVLVGTSKALGIAVQNDKTRKRFTHLAPRVRSALGNA
ncbi:MAG: ATP-dependent RecD-like DNA helicase [Synergistaceae bacterium]|nr:ATP-dependent RecD-like DNA helicase [Synergistaceae bacterium]